MVVEVEHFRTDHLMVDLKERSVRGGAVTLSAQGVKFALQMGSTMVLARLLTPADFGLVAMVTAVTGFVAMFKDAGLSMATVQRENITHEQVSTLFWFNVGLSLLLMLTVAAFAPVIAWFYGEPRLTGISLVLAVTFVFSGLTVQHQALLRRQMKFSLLAVIDLLSMAAGITLAIAMALRNYSYWSLVGMAAASALVNCILVWRLSPWRPGLPVRRCGAGAMLRFGGGLTGFNVLNYFTRNADNVIVGYFLGSASLGIYSRAYRLLMMPMQQINTPVASVMLPSLSRLQDDPRRYRSAYLRAVGMLAFIGMPIVAFLFVVANDVVTVVLGAGWEGAATIFRWLAPAAILGTVNVAPGWLCVTLGRAKVQVVWAAISAPITIAAFLLGAHWGAVGVAAAFSSSWCVLFILFLVMACQRSPVSIVNVITCIALPLVASIISACACILIVSVNAKLATAPSFAANALIFAVTYSAISGAFPSGRGRFETLWRDGIGVLMSRRRSKVKS